MRPGAANESVFPTEPVIQEQYVSVSSPPGGSPNVPSPPHFTPGAHSTPSKVALYASFGAVDAEGGSPWRSRGARFSVILNALGGLFLGYAIGFIPMMFQYHAYVTDCTRYGALDSCTDLTAHCLWNGTERTCSFPDHAAVNCSSHETSSSCGVTSACYWHFHDATCVHNFGWSAGQMGLIAGMQIIGATLASMAAGPLNNAAGRRPMVAGSGITALVSCVFLCVGWHRNQNFTLLVIGELFSGAVSGVMSVTAPMYCGEMAHRSISETIGVIFQLAVTFGIMFAGALGLAFNPGDSTATGQETRIQFVMVPLWIIAVGMLAASVLMPESTLFEAEKRDRRVNNLLADDETHRSSKAESIAAGTARPEPSNNIFKLRYANCLLVGLALAAGQQLTGINAVITYSPLLVGAVGLSPLLGNFVLVLWAFAVCLCSIPLVRRVPPRTLFIGGCALAAVACALIGVALCPGVFEANSTAQHALAGLGFAVFVAAFDAAIGPCFYVLAQDVFPSEVRSAGTSYTIWIQFGFNVAVNWGFPIAKTALSGGPSGDQNLGMSICFFVFGVIAALTSAVLHFRMPFEPPEMRAQEVFD